MLREKELVWAQRSTVLFRLNMLFQGSESSHVILRDNKASRGSWFRDACLCRKKFSVYLDEHVCMDAAAAHNCLFY